MVCGLSPLEGWREMDSSFQYAGAVNLVVSPFGWVVLLGGLCFAIGCGPGEALLVQRGSATGLGDLSRRPRGGPPPVGPPRPTPSRRDSSR